MSRNLDISINEYYHVYNRGVDRKEIFKNDFDYNRFIALLYLCNSDKVIQRSDFLGKASLEEIFRAKRGKPIVAIGAYCLMPNHFHILLKEIIEDGISKFMLKLGTSYSMFFNKKYQRTGALFESRFKAQYVDDDRYIKYLYSYIHLNPIKLIQDDWKEFGIKDIGNASKFLLGYKYSSFLDYYQDHKRFNSTILSPEIFPNYFSTGTEHIKELEEWLKTSRPGLDV